MVDNVESFEDGVGNAQIEHLKKQAKKRQRKVVYKTYFTERAGKVLQVTFKPNGCYTSYFARRKMLGEAVYKEKVREWSAKGLWIAEHEFDEKKKLLTQPEVIQQEVKLKRGK